MYTTDRVPSGSGCAPLKAFDAVVCCVVEVDVEAGRTMATTCPLLLRMSEHRPATSESGHVIVCCGPGAIPHGMWDDKELRPYHRTPFPSYSAFARIQLNQLYSSSTLKTYRERIPMHPFAGYQCPRGSSHC